MHALLDYFRIGKLSSGKSPSTIEQYIRAVHQLCDFCHKEMNLITTDDVMYFMVRYKEQNNGLYIIYNIRGSGNVCEFLYKNGSLVTMTNIAPQTHTIDGYNITFQTGTWYAILQAHKII